MKEGCSKLIFLKKQTKRKEKKTLSICLIPFYNENKRREINSRLHTKEV